MDSNTKKSGERRQDGTGEAERGEQLAEGKQPTNNTAGVDGDIKIVEESKYA